MTTSEPSSRYIPRPLSRTSSQDSFARDPSEDPEERFLAKSKQFAIPLSQLGLTADEGPDTNDTSNRSMFAYSSGRQQHFITSSPHGRVLVEATPSHSSGSQSQDASRNLSDPMEATQILDEPEVPVKPNRELDMGGNTSGYESSEPTSSFGRLLDGIHDPDPDAQPTQPSTQPHLSNPASGPFHGGWSDTPATGTATTSYPQSSGPRSLVSLVRPENQWRYQKYQQPKQIMPSVQSHSKGHISSFGQETQPSYPRHSSVVPNPSRLASNLSSNVHHNRNRSSTGDAMDVVPDSEPMCSDQRHVSMTNRLSKTPSATKHNNNVNNEACQDIVMGKEFTHPQDEGDEMDEEDDIPLALMSRKQSKSKVGPKAIDQRRGKVPQKTIHTASFTKQNIKVR